MYSQFGLATRGPVSVVVDKWVAAPAFTRPGGAGAAVPAGESGHRAGRQERAVRRGSTGVPTRLGGHGEHQLAEALGGGFGVAFVGLDSDGAAARAASGVQGAAATRERVHHEAS